MLEVYESGVIEIDMKLRGRDDRIMTDFCAEAFWTVVAELEVPDLPAVRSGSRRPSTRRARPGSC